MFAEATIEETELALSNRTSSQEDSRLVVAFTIEPWQDRAASAKQGRPIFVEREYIMIMTPGDKDNIIHRPASQMDIDRFPTQYQRFKNKSEQKFGSGTPLRAVGFLNSAQVKELEYFNIYTVEQLANVSDANAQKFMGFSVLRQAAQDFLRVATEQAPLTAMRAEMEEKDNKIAAQERAIEELGQRLKALEEARTEA